MLDYAYYNGVFTPYDACCIPLSDRSIFFSDAVYDVILGVGGKPYQLDEHLERLIENALRIGLADFPSKVEILSILTELLSISRAENFVLYIQLSGKEKRRSHLRSGGDANLLITVTSTEIPEVLGFVDAITLEDKRHRFCDVKTTNLLPAVLSMSQASSHGADIAIFHRDVFVTECSSANISFLKGNTLVTHPLDSDILPGISERNLISAALGLGFDHLRRPFSIDELFSADLTLVTSTTKLLKVCKSIDGKALPDPRNDVANTLFSILRNKLPDKNRTIC